MGWELIEENSNTKPLLNNNIMVHDACVNFLSLGNEQPEIVANPQVAYDILSKQVKKGTASFLGYLAPETFIPSKKLIKENKSLIKLHLKIKSFRIEKSKMALNKDTKTCPKCKVNYPLQMPCSFSFSANKHVKKLEKEIELLKKELNNDDQKSENHTDLFHYQNLTNISCKACGKENILLTEPSSRKINEMENSLLEKARDYFKNRELEQNKQALKDDAIILYKIVAIIHERDVDRNL